MGPLTAGLLAITFAMVCLLAGWRPREWVLAGVLVTGLALLYWGVFSL